MSRAPADDLARLRRSHLGRLLFELSRHFEQESLRRLHERGHGALTLAQKQVVVHLPLAGARLTDIAARAGTTKQGMMKLVDGLEALGYVERAADPDDGRAKVVQLTDAGRALLDDGLDVVRELEAEYAAAIGEKRLGAAKGALSHLVDALGVRMPDPSAD